MRCDELVLCGGHQVMSFSCGHRFVYREMCVWWVDDLQLRNELASTLHRERAALCDEIARIGLAWRSSEQGEMCETWGYIGIYIVC